MLTLWYCSASAGLFRTVRVQMCCD